MKSLVQFIQESVTNHYTPIGNILINVKNIFGAAIGGLVCTLEDNDRVLKISSSKFTEETVVSRILYSYNYVRNTCLDMYIRQQGLNDIRIVPNADGSFSIVCTATDIEEPSKYMPTDCCKTIQ